MYACEYVCVRVCVRERDRDRETGGVEDLQGKQAMELKTDRETEPHCTENGIRTAVRWSG